MIKNEASSKIKKLKKRIVEIAKKNKVGHIPSCFSSLEILYILYTKIVNITKQNAQSVNRDRVIISKEHCKLALICVLAELDLIPKNIINEWMIDGGIVGHDIFKEVANPQLAAIDASFGSLGQGIGVGIGMALANPYNHIYVIVGDGELQEGSCWEGIMFIGHNRIKNITIIVDRNNIQGSDYTKNIIDTSSKCVEQISSFNLDVIECNGHNIDELDKVFNMKTKKPKCIVANTIKGKECLFVAEQNGLAYLHNYIYTQDQFDKILEAIND